MEKITQQEGSKIIAKMSNDTKKTPISSMTEKSESLCAECHGGGWIQGTKGLKRCPCVLEKAIRAALPERYLNARIVDFPRKISDAVAMWLADPTDGLFVTGPTGTGKTHLAAGIYRAWSESIGKPVKFRRAADLYARIRESYHAVTSEISEQSIMDDYATVPYLVLDDVASGSISDHERRTLLEVLDRRVNDLRPTVITSNLSLEEIAAKMDERIASRLKSFRSLAFIGGDRREMRSA